MPRILAVVLMMNICAASSVAESQPATAGTLDPVAHATDLIRRTNLWWTDVGYAAKVAQYRVGWIAAPGFAYGLLAAPAVALGAFTHGVPGVAGVVAGDALVGALELTVGSPDLAARRLATGVRDLSLAEYAEAKALASPVLRGQPLSEDQARRFLALRWGVIRLEIAGELFASTNSLAGFRRDAADAATWSAISTLADEYQLRQTGRTVPVVEAVELAARALAVLEQAQMGVAAHAGYRRYRQRLAALAAQQQAEFSALRPSPSDGSSVGQGSTTVDGGGPALSLDRAAEPLLRGCDDSPMEDGIRQTLRPLLTPAQGEVPIPSGRMVGLPQMFQGRITSVSRFPGVDEETFRVALRGVTLWGFPVRGVEVYSCRTECGINGMVVELGADSAAVAPAVAARRPQRRSTPVADLQIRVYRSRTGGAAVVCDRSS